MPIVIHILEVLGKKSSALSSTTLLIRFLLSLLLKPMPAIPLFIWTDGLLHFPLLAVRAFVVAPTWLTLGHVPLSTNSNRHSLRWGTVAELDHGIKLVLQSSATATHPMQVEQSASQKGTLFCYYSSLPQYLVPAKEKRPTRTTVDLQQVFAETSTHSL